MSTGADLTDDLTRAKNYFGTVFVTTARILFLSVVLIGIPELALLLFFLFLAPNLVAWALWRRRQTVPPGRGAGVLVLCAGVSSLAALVALDAFGELDALGTEIGNPRYVYLALLLYPVAFLLLRLRARVTGSRVDGGGGTPGPAPAPPGPAPGSVHGERGSSPA